jgi:hypothetical protein
MKIDKLLKDVYISELKRVYPELSNDERTNYNIIVVDKTNIRGTYNPNENIRGYVNRFKKTITIGLEFGLIDAIDTIQHELVHVIQYILNDNGGHKKDFFIILKKINPNHPDFMRYKERGVDTSV